MTTHAQVLIIEQFAEIKLRANAHCPDDYSEPNVEEFLLHDLNGVNVAPYRVVNSVCGSARASAQLIVDYGPNVIEGTYVVRDDLIGFGFADAEFTAHIHLQVESPTEVTIYSRGDLLRTDYVTYSDGGPLEAWKTQSQTHRGSSFPARMSP